MYCPLLWFLPHIKMNQPMVYPSLSLPLGPPSPPPFNTHPIGHHSALDLTLTLIQQVPADYPFSGRVLIHSFNATLSIHTAHLLHCVHKALLYVCISTAPCTRVHQHHLSDSYLTSLIGYTPKQNLKIKSRSPWRMNR